MYKIIVPFHLMIELGWSFGDDYLESLEMFPNVAFDTWIERADVVFYSHGEYQIRWRDYPECGYNYTAKSVFELTDLLYVSSFIGIGTATVWNYVVNSLVTWKEASEAPQDSKVEAS